jgi:hypothetical protein
MQNLGKKKEWATNIPVINIQLPANVYALCYVVLHVGAPGASRERARAINIGFPFLVRKVYIGEGTPTSQLSQNIFAFFAL